MRSKATASRSRSSSRTRPDRSMLKFVTTNEGKLREAREHLPVAVEQFDYDYVEIQADDLETIAEAGVRDAFEAAGGDPVIVDDAGLFIAAFDGFPGPYSAYVDHTIGFRRVWALAREEERRRATFRCVVAYCDGDRVESFAGSVPGTIVAPRGSGGFGYDPIFEYNGRTMAEMSTEEKNAISHRGRALSKLAAWMAGEPAERRGAK